MLIWKPLPVHLVLDEIPDVEGVLLPGNVRMRDKDKVDGPWPYDSLYASNHVVCIRDKSMMHELGLKGYGEQEGPGLLLKPFESLYLLYLDRLALWKGKRRISFNKFMEMCGREDVNILTKFLIYRDLRSRGYVVKDGFGFGSDFRVYERGQFGSKPAKFLVFGLSEGRQATIGQMQKKISDITGMRMDPIIAVIERRGEVIYYRINTMEFPDNRSAPEAPFVF